MGSRIVAVLLLVLSTCTSQTLGLSSGDLRLIGGTSNGGRLEIFYNGVWGTVCDDSFGGNEAESACRQLGFFGYSRYGSVGSLSYSRGIGTIWLDDVNCPNTRTPLLQCRHNSLGSHNCGHNEDVALVCITTPLSGDLRLVGSSSSSGRGRLEIYWLGQWGTVCDDGFGSTDANVACRQLAFSGAKRSGNVVNFGYSQGTGIIWLTNVDCSTSNSMLRFCRSTGLSSSGGVTSCSHSEDVALECFISSNSSSSSNGDLRLVGSSSRGRLEVFINGIWGTVCDDSFGSTEADVACRQLGFPGATQHGSVRSLGFLAGTGQIWLDNVNCFSSTTRLINCRHNGLGVHNCVHSEDVAIACGNPTSVGGIIGGVIGGLVAFGFLIFFFVICCVACAASNTRSRRRRTVAPPQPAAYTVVATSNQGGVAMQQPASYPVQQYNANPQEPPAAYPKNSELQSAPPPSYDTAIQHYPPASTAGGGAYPGQAQQAPYPQAQQAPYPQTSQAPTSYPTAYPPTQIPNQYPDSNAPLPGQHPDPAYPPTQPQGISAPHPADAYPPGAPPPSAPPPSF